MIRFPYSSYRAKPAIASRASEAKRINKIPTMPLEIKSLDPKYQQQKGSVRISTLVSIPLATIGAFLGTAIQFHVIRDTIAKAPGIDKVGYLDFISSPQASMDYLSVAASGLLGAFVGVGIAKFPALLDQNGDQ